MTTKHAPRANTTLFTFNQVSAITAVRSRLDQLEAILKGGGKLIRRNEKRITSLWREIVSTGIEHTAFDVADINAPPVTEVPLHTGHIAATYKPEDAKLDPAAEALLAATDAALTMIEGAR